MGYIVGEGRSQGSLFPVALDDLVPANHVCRVIDAFVTALDMTALGFERAEAADLGRPGYDPRDLLKLYLYGYLQQLRSSRRLEAECRRNVELMWLLGRIYPDHKSISEFRRLHREAVSKAGGQLIQFARGAGLIRGDWIAIDGSKFRAVSSAKGVREREAMARYLERLETADREDAGVTIDPAAVAAALEKLKAHPEPEARFMASQGTHVPAYNVQTAVDAEHALIVAHEVTTEATDNRSLQPMAEAAKKAVGDPDTVHVVADAGYSNGKQARMCEEQGIVPHVPSNRSINNHGDGELFDRSAFTYDPRSDTFRCPGHQILYRKQQHRKDRIWIYAAQAEACGSCALKSRCTAGDRRYVTRHWDDEVLIRMNQRATPEAMRLRRSTVEHPFGTLKYRIFGHPRFLLRGRRGAQTEMSLAVLAYNLKRMINILGGGNLAARLAAV
jgi:transposase